MDLAGAVKSILGADCKVSYAADWTEYGAYQAGGGDILFPLDPLWADNSIDFVGIDWYPPMGDWREGDDHLDAIAGYTGPEDTAYLFAQLEGGEGYDWYYANESDRLSQIRTPIEDTAHGEDWVFRVKDIRGWWENAHYERPGGVRQSLPTPWVPGHKPVRLTEIGFPAVDKGTNAPNLFFDPKSSESAVPAFSNGTRNDRLQARALEVSLAHFKAQAFIDGAYVWAWDARPWPDFPAREAVWGDGPNWRLGHWLNGRLGYVQLSDVVTDICNSSGVSAFDASELEGGIEGFALNGIFTTRQALTPLMSAYGFTCIESQSVLLFRPSQSVVHQSIPKDDLVEPGLQKTRALLDKSPQRLRLAYLDLDSDLQPAIAETRRTEGDPRLVVDESLPLLMTETDAQHIAEHRLEALQEAETARIAVGPAYAALEPGDLIEVEEEGVWRIDAISEGLSRTFDLSRPTATLVPRLNVEVPPPAAVNDAPAQPELVVIDGPPLVGAETDTRPILAAAGTPWAGGFDVRAGLEASSLTLRGRVETPAILGRLDSSLASGPVGRWDKANMMDVALSRPALSSVSETSALSGANAALIGGASGWELVIFQTAELVSGTTYRLSQLLRGLQGTESLTHSEGAFFVLLDSALARGEVSLAEMGASLFWEAGGFQTESVWKARAAWPWSIAHLRAKPEGEGWVLSWVRRGVDVPDQWDGPDPIGPFWFAVEYDEGTGWQAFAPVSSPEIQIPNTAIQARVAEIGSDGRYGPWVSIAL